MRPLFLFIMFIELFSGSIKAQTSGIIEFSDSIIDSPGFYGIIDDVGNYVMIGLIGDSLGYAHIVIFDSNYNHKVSIKLNEINSGGSAYPLELIQTQDENFIALFTKSQIIKFDISGNILWKRHFWSGTPSEVVNIMNLMEDENGDIYLGGTKRNYPLIAYRTAVVKLNSNGNILWSKVYDYTPDPSKSPTEACIIKTNDGNILFQTQISNVSVFIKFDVNGNIIWSSSVDLTPAYRPFGIKVIQSNKDNSYFAVGRASDTNSSQDAFTLKLDSNGNYVNHKLINYLWDDQYDGVCQDKNDNFIVIGRSKPHEVCGGNLMITKFNHNNDTIMHRTYGASAGQGMFFRDIKNHSSGGFYSIGSGSMVGYDFACVILDTNLNLPCYSINYNYHEITVDHTFQNNVIAFSSSFSTSYDSSYTYTNTYLQAFDRCTGIPLNIDEKIEIDNTPIVYPNPTRGKVQLDFNDMDGELTVQVFSIDGRVIENFSSINSNNLKVDLSYHPNGIYFFNVRSGQDYKTFKVLKY